MARRPFGGTTADIAQDPSGDRVAGATVTVWTAETGGTQLTDLQTPAAVAIADGEVTSDSNGIISFLGPDDGTSVVWADGGLGGRTKMLATDLADRVEVLEDSPGGGAVDSVNGQTGVVVLDAADVGADASGSAAAAQAAAATDATTKANAAQAAAIAASQPVDPDLTAISALDSTTAGVLVSEGSGWVRRTFAQTKTLLGLTKSDVGLGNVDNTADTAKPISTATQTALDLKLSIASAIGTYPAKAGTETISAVWTFTAQPSGIVKASVGLGNVDNTADTAKPVSTAQQTALDLKANLASPALTGSPTAPTQTNGDNSTKLATTAYADGKVAQTITNGTTTSAPSQDAVFDALALKADLASPALTGSPTAPTASARTATTQVATTAYVDAEATATQRNTQTGTTYTTVLGDAGKVVRCTNASAVTVTIPPNSSVAYPTDTVLSVYSGGAGGVTIAPGSGVTIRNNSSGLTQYGECSLRKDATDEWVRIG